MTRRLVSLRHVAAFILRTYNRNKGYSLARSLALTQVRKVRKGKPKNQGVPGSENFAVLCER